jgi:glycosyltransferase involved in cell wall biosynthesis
MEMRKIKVAMLAPYSTHSKRSGSVIHIEKTIRYLSYRDDIELHVVTIGNKNMQFKKGDLDVHVIKKSLPYPFSIPSIVWHLRREMIRINPDIVHAEMTTAPYSTVAALVRNRYPVLLTVMGVVLKEIRYQKGIGLIFYTLLHKPNERYVISKIPHIIVQSSHIKNLFSKMTNSKIYVVPEGIECEKIRDTPPHDLNEKIDTFIAVELVRLKGIDILIKAISTVIKSVPDVKVYIAGSGKEEGKLKSMVKNLGLERRVKFLGYISDEEEINRYYKACKIVVVPSRWDVDPFAPLNAAASGKPAIVSDMCNSSVIENGKTGFVFKTEDVEELSSKMVKLLTDDKLREEMGKAVMEKAKEYDWSKIVNRKVEIYKEVIADFHERKRKGKNRSKKSFI